MAQLQSITINDTGSLTIPAGDQTTRPAVTTTVDSFTSVGTTTWTCPAGVSQVEVLIVGGGGGTGYDVGGGGGGGGLIYRSNYPVTAGTAYTVTVGSGGSSGQTSTVKGSNGGNSVFDTLIALGGGGGGSYPGNGIGLDGGSGGGGGDWQGGAAGSRGGLGTLGQGHAGGKAANATWGSAGGGGAGGPGADGIQSVRVPGGPGLTFTITGSPQTYAGGGYGNADSGSVLATGQDLNGITQGTYGFGANGTGSPNNSPYSGSSGCVIIRYSTSAVTTQAQGVSRFNTTVGRIETYTGKNTYIGIEKPSNYVKNGLVLDMDAANYPGTGATWQDSSDNRFSASLTDTTYNSNNGGYFSFNGSSSYSFLTNSTVLDLQTVSVECWFRTSDLGQNGFLFEKGQVNTQYAIFFESGSWRWRIQPTGDGSSAAGSAANFNPSIFINKNQWNHVVCTFRSGERKTYFNGYLVGQDSFSSTIPVNTYGINIGRHSSGYYFNGDIAVVRVYNRVLSEYEVSKNYGAFADRFDRSQQQAGYSALGMTPQSAASSALALWDAGYRANGLYWIRLDRGTIPVYCDLTNVSPDDGKAGWMLVASWANASQWTLNSTSQNFVFGRFARNCFSSNFGNEYIRFMRVQVAQGVDAHSQHSSADFYYHWSKADGYQWKTIWAAGSGTNTHWQSTGSAVPRISLRQFSYAHNLKFGYRAGTQTWANLSDLGTSGGSTGTEAWADWYSGLTTPGVTLGVYSYGRAPDSDGTLAILAQSQSDTMAGQDTNNQNAKFGYDDGGQTYYSGSQSREVMGANTGTKGSDWPLWMWIK